MKMIKLYAYWAQNLGDDLMVDILLKKYPQYCFYSENCCFSNQFLEYPNFKNRDYYYRKFGRLNHLLNLLTLYRQKDWFFKLLFQKLDKKCICSVYIGGSIYMQDCKSEEWIEQRIRSEDKKLKTGPLFVIGANFGEILSEAFIEAFKQYFSRCGGVSFRDKASYLLFAELTNVQYAPDVVFNLEECQKKTYDCEKVLISVIDFKARKKIIKYAEIYEKFIISICNECISRGKTPVLVSFCKQEGDENAIYRIWNRLDESVSQKTGTFFYKGNREEALNLFQSAEMIVATRFHAMVLAIRYNKPFFAISYNDKVINVLKDIDSTMYCTLEELADCRAEAVFMGTEEKLDTINYMDDAKHQFFQLEEYLNHLH